MPNFDIVKNNEVEKTFRVAHVISDFDVKPEHSNEHFKGVIKIPDKWNIGVIVGNSGTGKTTIIKTIIDIYEQRKNKVVLCAPTRTSCKKNDRNNRKRSLNIT